MQVGFIGLGTMGSAMASNLQQSDVTLVVHDLFPASAQKLIDRGAGWASSPREVAERSDVVLTSLPGPTEVAAVMEGEDGILAATEAPQAVFDLSTNAWDVVRRIGYQARTRGIDFSDAPVSGGPQGAIERKLAVWVGGEIEAFERFRPALDAIADRVRHVGELGAGTVVKLIHNAAGNTINRALADLFAVGVEAGVDPAELWQSMREGAVGRRRTFDGLPAQFLRSKYDPPNLTVDLARKDTSLVLRLAEALGLALPLVELAAESLEEAAARGWSKRDSRVAMSLSLEALRTTTFQPVTDARIREAFDEDPPASGAVVPGEPGSRGESG